MSSTLNLISKFLLMDIMMEQRNYFEDNFTWWHILRFFEQHEAIWSDTIFCYFPLMHFMQVLFVLLSLFNFSLTCIRFLLLLHSALWPVNLNKHEILRDVITTTYCKLGYEEQLPVFISQKAWSIPRQKYEGEIRCCTNT